jgi:hypothetical protein
MLLKIVVRRLDHSLHNFHIIFKFSDVLLQPSNIGTASLVFLTLKYGFVLVADLFQQDSLIVFLHTTSVALTRWNQKRLYL